MVIPARRYQRGSLKLAAGRWTLRFRADEVDPDTGEIRRRHRQTVLGTRAQYPNEKAARAAAELFILQNGGAVRGFHTMATFRQWGVIYAEQVAPNLRPSTAASYRSIIGRRIVRHFGDLGLHDLTTRAVQEWITAEGKAGARQSTQRVYLAVLSAFLRAARRFGYSVGEVDRRAIDFVPEAPREAARTFTPEESGALIAAAPQPWRALFALLSTTGLRISEALGLKWADVDPIGGQLHPRRQYYRGREVALKTRESDAAVALPPFALAELEAYRAWLTEREEAAPPPGAWLFANPATFLPYNLSTAYRALARTVRAAGLPAGGLHAFRHGYVTAAFERAGADAATVRGMARHSNLATTQGYARTVQRAAQDAADRIGAAIGAAVTSTRQDTSQAGDDHGEANRPS